MKVLIIALFAAAASASDISESSAYVRDLRFESTTRAFEKDASTNEFNCEPGFTGSDCSLLKCPYSMSFVAAPTAADGGHADWLYTPSNARHTNSETDDGDTTSYVQWQRDTTFDNMHGYKECGGRGVCDRSTGECDCFDSYTGEGCRRSTCPNDCSGHGTCMTDANSFYYVAGDTPQTPTTPYSSELPGYMKTDGSDTWGISWTWSKYQQCHCDRGYEGDDCSLRQCPQGDDPETTCDDDLGQDVQTFTCSFENGATSAWFNLGFTDQFDGHYTTRPIKVNTGSSADENAKSIQDALEALPNFAIPEVEIDYTTVTTGTRYDFEVTFVAGANSGKQSLLTFSPENSCGSGSQPKFEVVNAGGDYTCTVARSQSDGGDYKEQDVCSNRGICDSSSGQCECFDGYYGASCDAVTTYI